MRRTITNSASPQKSSFAGFGCAWYVVATIISAAILLFFFAKSSMDGANNTVTNLDRKNVLQFDSLQYEIFRRDSVISLLRTQVAYYESVSNRSTSTAKTLSNGIQVDISEVKLNDAIAVTFEIFSTQAVKIYAKTSDSSINIDGYTFAADKSNVAKYASVTFEMPADTRKKLTYYFSIDRVVTSIEYLNFVFSVSLPDSPYKRIPMTYEARNVAL